MTRILITIFCIIFINDTFGQHTYFAPKGTIAFEKVVYTKARMREMMAKRGNNDRGMRFMGGNIDEMPESSTSHFTLKFDEIQTLMEPVEDASKKQNAAPRMSPPQVSGGRGNNGGGRNNNRPQNGPGNIRRRNNIGDKIYYQNLKDKTSEIQLQLDEKVVITDSMPDVTWRFTDEFRTIAGYECRRVNGATKDSLYLVAFYTEEIPSSGGPVLTSGLPGMILGLVIPEMHINYWATAVNFTNETVSKSWKDKKAKEMSSDQFFKLLSGTLFRNRGNNTDAQQKRQILEQILY